MFQALALKSIGSRKYKAKQICRHHDFIASPVVAQQGAGIHPMGQGQSN
jgi:Mg/Co/Ni transporter MgtE